MLRHGTLSSLCVLALWIGGCPKRQGPSRVVYVPAPAPQAAAAPPVTQPQVLVIEEPAPPPEPEEAPPPQTPEEPKPEHRRRRPVHPDTPTVPVETPEPPPEAVPTLEPRESTAQEAALRQQIQRMQDDVRQRLARLNEARLSPSERKTLEDARTFFTQSTHALESGDLQRALNLARKASLLVAALE
jgi:hypothetical protein